MRKYNRTVKKSPKPKITRKSILNIKKDTKNIDTTKEILNILAIMMDSGLSLEDRLKRVGRAPASSGFSRNFKLIASRNIKRTKKIIEHIQKNTKQIKGILNINLKDIFNKFFKIGLKEKTFVLPKVKVVNHTKKVNKVNKVKNIEIKKTKFVCSNDIKTKIKEIIANKKQKIEKGKFVNYVMSKKPKMLGLKNITSINPNKIQNAVLNQNKLSEVEKLKLQRENEKTVEKIHQ